MKKPRPWVTPALLAAAVILGKRTLGVLALPHEVMPVPRTTDALSLTLYVKSSVGDAYFVAIKSSAKVVPNSVTANDVVEPSRHDVFKDKAARNGSFPVRASERSAYTIDALACGEAYDVFFVIEAASSNGLFSPVGRVLGVSTNGAAPRISGLRIVPVDAKTNSTRMSLIMDAPGVPCRVWYTVLPLRDTVLLHIEEFSAKEIVDGARAAASVVDLPQGLKGERSPGQVCDGLESNSWYQVSAVAERAEDVFSEPIYAVVKTHREPARVMEIAAHPVPGSTDSLALLFRLDCSSASIISEACGLLSYKVAETPPNGSPDHVKPRQVAQGMVVVLDGRAVSHNVSGLSPGKAHSITITVEAPGSNGAFGPSLEVASTTFPRAPNLGSVEVSRCAVEPSTVTVRYKLSEPGVIHVSLAERVGHPLAMREVTIGNQHGVSFSREVGIRSGGDSDEEDSETAAALEGSQELYGLAAGSAFDVTARSESILSGRPSGVYGVSASQVVEAVPPVLDRVRARAPDATTTELVVEYEVRGTSGRLHYALAEEGVATKAGKDSLTNSAETVTLAVQGQAGVVLAGSTLIFPSTDDGSSNSDRHGDAEEKQPRQKLRFQGLKPTGRYFASLCTESNSGILSKVVAIGVETHAEAPLVASAAVAPSDRSAESLSLVIALESAGLVHLVVRRASEDAVKMRDHTIVYKTTREVNTTMVSSSTSQQGPPGGTAGGSAVRGVAIVETVDGLEPNAMYEVFIATETTNSNGVYRAKTEPLIATTHPVPPPLQHVHARAADASSSALIVSVSLIVAAEVHYAVFPSTESNDQARHALSVPALPLQTDHGGDIDEVDTINSLEHEEGEEEKEGGYHDRGCGNATVSDRGPSALNDSIGLVASGVVLSAFHAGSGLAENEHTPSPVSRATATPSTEDQTRLPWRYEAGGELGAVFRVEGLEAGTAYDICLFTETMGSNGLFGEIHQLRGVSTHAPVPQLASEKVACTLDCVDLNRDPCWLEANKCGECFQGFVGKAGHVNSPCGKVSSLTEADIARIAEREREDRIDESRNQLAGLADEFVSSNAEETADEMARISHTFGVQDGAVGGAASARPDAIVPDGHGSRASQGKKTMEVTGGGGLVEEKMTAPAMRLLLGVPVPTGPNVTKFLYVEVPENHSGGGRGRENHSGGDGNASARNGPDDFDAKTAAAGLCVELRKKGEEPPTCLISLAEALASRFNNGHFHTEDDAERPILQVEVDAPGGESLAFTLRHGEDAGSAAVGFCRENQGILADEQACVIMLMQDMPLPVQMWDA